MEKEILKGRKILIVEDDFYSRLYLNKILEKEGVVIHNAEDGQEAIEAVIAYPEIELILMDIQLPVMDGYIAAEKIKGLRKEIIIIAQTAYGMLGDKEKILASGFDDFIIKPIVAKNLIDKLIANLSVKKHS